ncbi:hypothetical protein B7R21_03340 [Subtercola boreus]|uniref:Peptidase M10 metallopeptidase domain-containing protein n=1 Tax=Subtercola boreus TaxID=120213 RepID=A0A3E0W0B8_9MICO|nr:hypothetical protein B7R21_03340 [Subtercola boreus]
MVAGALVLLLSGQSVAHAGVADGECKLGETRFLEGEPGWSQSVSQVCGGNFTWNTEATYYWTDDTKVIWEPWEDNFDYSFFSDLDPFKVDSYSFRKANELFPDTSDREKALAKSQYAMSAMSAKARAIESRGNVKNDDICLVAPERYSDAEIAANTGWLPPQPTPDGSVGTYTYSLANNLSAEQRAVVLAGLATFDEARSGSQQPKMVEWQPGSAVPPVITFQSFPEGVTFADERYADVFPLKLDAGRDGLQRLVSGQIRLTPEADNLSEWVIVHELLHAYGFRHNPDVTDDELMSPSRTNGWVHNSWSMTSEDTPKGHAKVDSCTKAGIEAASAPR